MKQLLQGLALSACAFVAGPALAVSIAPLSYSMINGGGQASGGSFNYWDAGYTGSGNVTTDGAPLSGGLGKLTDGIVATQRWDAVSNNAGTGQYVGWRAEWQPSPLITFTFAPGSTIDRIDIAIDNSQFGGVFAPSQILIDGNSQSFSAPPGNGILLSFTGLNLTGTSHTVQFIQTTGTWTFVSEISFSGSVGAVPEPAPALLAVLGALGLFGWRRRTLSRT